MKEIIEDWNLSGLERPTIREIVLGEYKPGQGVRIYHPTSEWNSRSITQALVELHESVHLNLCLSTTFGYFQRLLGSLLQVADLPNTLRQSYQSALDSSIKHSWFIHEGAATLSETTFALLANKELALRHVNNLKPNYRYAAEFLYNLLESGSPRDCNILVLQPLIDAIGYVVLSTQILDHMLNHTFFLKTDWNKYYSDPKKSPDARLHILRETAELSGTHRLLFKEAAGISRSVLGDYKTSEEFTALWKELGLKKQCKLNDRIWETAVSLLSHNMPFPVVKGTKKFRRFWRKALSKNYGISHSMLANPGRPLKSVNQRITLSMDIDYVIGDSKLEEDGSGVFVINFSDSKLIWSHYKKDADRTLYAHLIYNPDSEARNIGPLIMEAGGGHLLMRGIIREPNGKKYILPFQPDNPELASAYCIIMIAASEIANALEQLRDAGGILSMHLCYYPFTQTPFREIISNDFPSPVCIIPPTSTLNHWEALFKQVSKTSHLFMLDEKNTNTESLRSAYCILVKGDGSQVYARPTSDIVKSWLVKRCIRQGPKLKHIFSNSFSEEWNERLDMFLAHYYRFGF